MGDYDGIWSATMRVMHVALCWNVNMDQNESSKAMGRLEKPKEEYSVEH